MRLRNNIPGSLVWDQKFIRESLGFVFFGRMFVGYRYLVVDTTIWDIYNENG